MALNNPGKRSYTVFVKRYIAENEKNCHIYPKYAYEYDNAELGEIDVLLVSKEPIGGKRIIVAATLVNELNDLKSAIMPIATARCFFEKSAVRILILNNEPYTIVFPLVVRADYGNLSRLIEQIQDLGDTDVVFFHKDKKHEESIRAIYWLETNGYIPKGTAHSYVRNDPPDIQPNSSILLNGLKS